MPEPFPADCRNDEKAFFINAAWDIREWVLPLCSSEPMQSIVVGEGEDERFTQLPTPCEL